MFRQRRKRAATTALLFAHALGELTDQFEGRVTVSNDGGTLHLFASIPSTTLAAVIAKMRRPVSGPDADRDDA